jgi:hypothetical protein
VRALPLLLALAVAAPPTAPRVDSIAPLGGQRGTEVSVLFRGERLGEAEGLVQFGPGIEVLKVTAAADKQDHCEVRLRLCADCPLGAHPLRLRTAHGLSNLQTFSVGVLPCLRSQPGPAPQDVPLGCSIDGDLRPDSVDRFAVDVPAGAHVVCEVESLRLGRNTDLALAVVAADGSELAGADDTALGRKDPWCAFTAATAMRCEVRVRAAVPGDADRGPYRLHVGTFPRPTGALPCGGAPGQELDVALVGDVPAGAHAKVTLPADGSDMLAWFPEVAGAVPPTPIWLHVGALANVAAVADDKGNKVFAIPGAVHGVVGAPGGSAKFRFHAVKGQTVELRVVARALRSPLDPVLSVRATDGRVLVSNDDATSPDSALRFEPPADGDYDAEVRDLLHAGSPEHFFRLEAGPRPAATRLSMVVQRQEEPTLAVPQGGRAAAVLQTAGLDAAVELLAADLPPGVTAEFGPRAPGTTLVPVLLAADDDAPRLGTLLGFQGSKSGAMAPLEFAQTLTLVNGKNDFPVLQTTLRQLPLAVTVPAPFQVRVAAPTVPIVRGAPLALAVDVSRDDGFTGRVRVRALWTAPGLGCGQTNFDEKTTAGSLPLDANGGAAIGTFPLVLLASTRLRNAPLTVALPFVPVQIVEPMIVGEIGSARTEQGKPVALPVTLRVVSKPATAYRAALVALPRGVTASEIELAADATAATFQLTVATDAACGRHRSVQVELRVPGAGGTLVHRIGGGELRIDAPLPATAAAGGGK